MKVAYIGASHWHLPFYLEPVLDMPGVTVAGVSDPDPKAVASLSERLDCVGDTDFRELCARVKPDFVFALGRHIDMPAQAQFLIDAGIPFALEKPCGLNAQDVSAIARRAEAAGAFAAVPLVFRNGDFFPILQDLAAEGGLQYMTYRFIAGFPARYRQAGCEWMLDPRLSGGGCTINLAVHFFDLCSVLMGPDVGIRQSTMSNAAWGHPVEDYSAVTFERGRDLGVVETGYLYPAPTSTFDMHYAVRSPKHYLVAHNPETIEVVDVHGVREMRRALTTNVPHYRTFVFDVLARAKSGRKPIAGLSDMVPVMRLMDEAYAKAGPLGPA
jgi:predicted dehydrogenase